MSKGLQALLEKESKKLEQAGLKKTELAHESEHDARQGADFTSGDYLGLGDDPDLRAGAMRGLNEHGLGISRSRALGGTRTVHKDLERTVAEFFSKDDAVAYATGYMANIGLFETLFDNRDLIFCDAWVNPSLLEGARLSSARVVAYKNGDMDDLEDKLRRSKTARFRVVVTDGVFGFSGEVAPLDRICDLASKYGAVVVVDETLCAGVIGANGRGASEQTGAISRVDVITGSFAPVLGGVMGGYTVSSAPIIDWLRQKSTPYLFGESLAPCMAVAAVEALDRVTLQKTPLAQLQENISDMREALESEGFEVVGDGHPIMTVMIGEAMPLQKILNMIADENVLAHGLCYPVVPERQARVRLQVTAWHTQDDLIDTAAALGEAARKFGIIK